MFEVDSFQSELSSEQLLYRAKTFDHIDAVCLVGPEDAPRLDPWDTAFRPLHSVIKMCSKTEMPVIASSFAAIIYGYVIIAQSCFSYVLNSKNEDGSTQRLQHLTEYAEGHRAVWIHRESGDVFAYDSNSMSWFPTGNLGMSFQGEIRFEHDRCHLIYFYYEENK